MADAHHLSNFKVNTNLAPFREGDTVRVNFRIQEGESSRIQAFQGVVIKKGGAGPAASFTVRRVAFSTGIERTFPIHSPFIESVTVIRPGRVRRAKLFYLRELSGRAARVKERRGVSLADLNAGVQAPSEAVEEQPADAAPAEQPATPPAENKEQGGAAS
jgi:large subunit ribosomal protein L19